MSLKTIKRLASAALKVGTSHIKILDPKRASEALTREDVKALIKDGAIKGEKKKGVGRGKAKEKQARKKLGRRVGTGSKKGKLYSKVSRKTRWIRTVRSQRKLLNAVSDSLVKGSRKRVYAMIRGGAFTSKKQLLNYLKTNKLLK